MGSDPNTSTHLLPLPPGFRFHPSEQELLSHYLPNKRLQSENQTIHLPWHDLIPLINLYDYDPSDLPITHNRYYCFSLPRKHGYKRKAKCGVWKSKKRKPSAIIQRNGIVLGYKKRFVFYRRGKGLPLKKTNWVLIEYTLSDSPKEDAFCICCVQFKSQPSGSRQTTYLGAGNNFHAALGNNDVPDYEADKIQHPLPEVLGHDIKSSDSYDLEGYLVRLSDMAEYSLVRGPATDGNEFSHEEFPSYSMAEQYRVIDHGCACNEVEDADFIELDDLVLPLEDEFIN